MPPLCARHRGDVGEDIGAQRQIAVVAEAPVILAGQFEPVDLCNPDIGDEEAGCTLAIRAKSETRQWQDTRAEQLEHRTRKADDAGLLVVNHPLGRDPPTGIGGAAFGIDHRAGAVGGIGQHGDAVLPAFRRSRGEPAASAQGDEEFAHRAGIEFFRQFDLVGEQLVARLVDQPNIAAGDDPARSAVPNHFIGADRAVFRAQDHIAARGDGFRFVVVTELAGFEIDLARRLGLGGFRCGGLGSFGLSNTVCILRGERSGCS